MSDSDNYATGLSQRVRRMLETCPDYSGNRRRCRVYGTCRCLHSTRNPETEDLVIKWVSNCIGLQEAKRRGKSPLTKVE